MPVPTITTPVNAPSPFHGSPMPMPTPAPHSRPSPRRPEDDLPPFPIRNVTPSPSHPPYEIPPDNYIPYADDAESISIPPPHEFQEPVTPLDRTPPIAGQPLSEESEPNPLYIRGRDYAYRDERTRQPVTSTAALGGLGSPQSRTSTHISQFELIAPPRSHSAKNPKSYHEEFRQGIMRSQTPVETQRPITPMRPSSRMNVSVLAI